MAPAPSAWSARQGLITASSVLAAVGLAAFLGLQDLWWAAISAWVVANPDMTALWRKIAMRLAGTFVGLTVGYALAVAMEGQVLFQALALFIICAIGSYLRFTSRFGYAWFYGMITLMLMIAVSIMEPQVLFSFAQFRFAEISCGVFAVAFVHTIARAGTAPPPHAPATPHTPDLDLTRLALVAGLTAVAMVALWSWFDIPSMPQAMGSSLAVLDRDFATINVRARQRFLGCALGGGLGLLALLLPLEVLPLYAVTLFAGLFYFSRLHHGGGAHSYVGTQGGIAFITALVSGSGPPAELLPVVERLGGITVGVVLMVTIAQVLALLMRRTARA
ncbi:hypothetical protein GCM10007301_33060 [Azorhizobium oxalatiphilum]|uniref:Integral membrane bound transporter domain-containing protein n=1 Tax=Azorhizobium oxalatiphilum TaxID=980631 RepID=A0A917C3L2_9HYPH|nr:FUSC family protein [Azorhizobium oxalatiphilum]GGF70692.1 hypothetical protein GCM10007301_33060 [Azorhizobium oxalatiphilum]